jgi:hypothetical protein
VGKRLHRAYLVRCWQEGESTCDGKPIWRFSVEEVLHERYLKGFGSLEEMIAFLRVELTGHEDEMSEK